MTLFQHGVASGDPDTDSVVIWTRVTAADHTLTDVVAMGEVEATPDTDYTAQADVNGLQPDTHYW